MKDPTDMKWVLLMRDLKRQADDEGKHHLAACLNVIQGSLLTDSLAETEFLLVQYSNEKLVPRSQAIVSSNLKMIEDMLSTNKPPTDEDCSIR